jgi:hypothetical protein
MSANQQLQDAYIERLAKERDFFNLLTRAIKAAVDKFALCDISTSPEVEESVNLSIDVLNNAVRQLKEETVLNKEAAKDITSWFSTLAQHDHLVQGSIPATSSTPARSLADRAKGWLGFRPATTPAAWQDVINDQKNPNKYNPYRINVFAGTRKRRSRKSRRRV